MSKDVIRENLWSIRQRYFGLVLSCVIGFGIGAVTFSSRTASNDVEDESGYFREAWALYSIIGGVTDERAEKMEPKAFRQTLTQTLHDRLIEVLHEGFEKYPDNSELRDLAVGTLLRSESEKVPPLPKWLHDYAEESFEEARHLRP